MSKKIAYLHIEGMHCTNCVNRIEKSVTKMDGVVSVQVNGTTNKGKVVFDENKLALDKVLKRIDSLGFHAKLMQNLHESDLARLSFPFSLFVSLCLTIPLLFVMLAHINGTVANYIPSIFMHPLVQFLLAFPIQFMIGKPFYERAYSAIKDRTTNMDVLVVLSTSIAFFYSYFLMITNDKSNMPILYFDTSAFIITIILFGRYLEQRVKEKTLISLTKLTKSKQKKAIVLDNGLEKEIHIDKITRGNIVIIKPGEQIPVDGEIISGISEIDESLLTGESIPVPKQRSDKVYAGTTNHYGTLYVKVTKENNETVLNHIINTVQDAQLSKAKIQRIADQITAYFVPVIVLISIATFFLSYFVLSPGIVNEALLKMIAVLIIACPCALGLATPTSLMVASGRAARYGLLFKEGQYLERLSKITHIVFDKTGTITTGRFRVTDFYIKDVNHGKLLEKVAAVERFSTHPIGKALYHYAEKRASSIPHAKQIKVTAGLGIEGIVFDKKVMISNRKIENGLSPSEQNFILSCKQEGKTMVYIYLDDVLSAICAVRDEIKKETKKVVNALRKLQIEPIIASGDHFVATKQLAEELQIHQFYASCSPYEKAKIIQNLKKQGHHVAMVGDGINDAPALAAADVGIALTSGSDLAIQSGDVSILSNHLSHINLGIMLSKKTMRNIKQNFAWAFFYNVLMIPLAMFGILSPWFAALMMALSSITVLLNSLRLTRVKL